MGSNPLLIVGPPWIVVADVDSDWFALKVGELSASGGRVIEIDGANATTPAALFGEFAQSASLPAYFGRNWAALDECLADLEWLPGTSYVVILKRPGRLLESAPSERSLFVQVIAKVAAEWAEPVSDGEDWDRPSVPFHLVVDRGGDCGADGAAVEAAQSRAMEWLGRDITRM